MAEHPHGHHFRHHHQSEDDDRRPPPQQEYGYGGPPPQSEYGYGAPPPQSGYGYGAPPPQSAYGYGGPPTQSEHGYAGAPSHQTEYGRPTVQHVSHEAEGHHFFPHGHGSSSNDPLSTLMKQQAVRIYCKGNEDVSLAIRDGVVLLATTNKDDLTQHWLKDLKYSTKVKDEEGYPAFSLVNKATKQALKHSLGQGHPVQLAEYDPSKLEESVLWTESRDVGNNYRCIRMVNNIYLNFDGFHGDKKHGGVHDGTTLDLWKWTEGDNQRWKIVPWCKFYFCPIIFQRELCKKTLHYA